MSISSKLDRIHSKVRGNRWLRYFAVFNRLILALGFLPSGMQKVLGERFTVLQVNHPMGHYLDALYQTGYYYTSIGIMQVTAAILLLIPRTATLGAIIYFPIILNICILSLSVRFQGSLFTAPLMVLANLYLLCWDYHKLKFIFPFNSSISDTLIPQQKKSNNKLAIYIFVGVISTFFAVGLFNLFGYKITPKNTISECRKQCEEKENTKDCYDFCDCIYKEGEALYKCLDVYTEH